MKTKISIIAALDKNNVIGSTKTNSLLWRLPEDLRNFKRLTTGHAIIMGRKTHESIGKPLPNRLNIVISHDPYINKNIPNLLFRSSLDSAIVSAKDYENKKSDEDTREVFIIGGGQIYQQALSLVDKLYLSIVDAHFEGDVYFPDFSQFKKVISSKSFENEQFKWKFVELEK